MPKGMKNMRTLLLMIFAALSLSVSAQTITLKNGNVKDTTGEPIIGVFHCRKRGHDQWYNYCTWMEISLERFLPTPL